MTKRSEERRKSMSSNSQWQKDRNKRMRAVRKQQEAERVVQLKQDEFVSAIATKLGYDRVAAYTHAGEIRRILRKVGLTEECGLCFGTGVRGGEHSSYECQLCRGKKYVVKRLTSKDVDAVGEWIEKGEHEKYKQRCYADALKYAKFRDLKNVSIDAYLAIDRVFQKEKEKRDVVSYQFSLLENVVTNEEWESLKLARKMAGACMHGVAEKPNPYDVFKHGSILQIAEYFVKDPGMLANIVKCEEAMQERLDLLLQIKGELKKIDKFQIQ